MRGFVGGMVIGLLVAFVAAAVLSLLIPRAQGPDVGAQAPQSVTEAPDGIADRPTDPSGADADLAEALPIAPDAEATAPDGLGTLQDADTDPADKPEIGKEMTDLGSPQPRNETPDLDTDPSDASLPQTAGEAPVVPSDDQAASTSITSEPTQPPMPDLSAPETGFGARPPVASETPSVGSAPDVSVTEGNSPNVEQPGLENGPTVATDPGAAPQPETGTGTAVVPGVPTAPSVGTGDDSAVVAQAPGQPGAVAGAGDAPKVDTTTPSPQTPEPQTPDDTPPAVAELPQAGSETDETVALSPGLGTPVVPLTQRDTGATAPEAATTIIPFEAYAAPFDDPGDLPPMAIVLIDDKDSVGAEALREFPYPITFAIDPTTPGAADKMAIHRASGFEVVLMTNLPTASSPQDAEVSFEVWLDTLPETVAILEGTGTGFQGNRGLSDQVTDIALSTGRGLILQSSGLNTAQKLAARAGVPSSTVFRDFDGAGQTPTVMRRFLDQAAFRARQEGGVIMLGRVRPDTISALLLWGLQDRAQRVALVPVTAVLAPVAPPAE